MRLTSLAIVACLAGPLAPAARAQGSAPTALPARWDELTASAWPQAMEKSAQTCILPIGILEKHGPHAPIGSDIVHVRELAARATKQEYAVIFPEYFYGQINEARHQPGAFALPARLVLDLLDATCDEIGRNGFKRIVIVNGHGGNPELIRYFIQTRLERRRNHVVYFFTPDRDSAVTEKAAASVTPIPPATCTPASPRPPPCSTPCPVSCAWTTPRTSRAPTRSGSTCPDLYTAIWWYARFPNHYAGEGDKATTELGQVFVDSPGRAPGEGAARR